MVERDWIALGGWRDVDANVPVGVIVETVQLVSADIPSAPSLKSFQGGRWPVGNWHWEPEGHACSSEPSHWRARLSEAVTRHLEASEPATAT